MSAIVSRERARGLRLLFPEVIFHTSLAQHRTLKGEYFPIAREQCTSIAREWNCEVLTNRSQPTKPDYSRLIDAVAVAVTEMCTSMGIVDEVEFSVTGIWMNLYRKGHYQESHHHSSRQNNFSFVYFMNYDHERDAQLCFHNDRFQAYDAAGIRETLGVTTTLEIVEVLPLDVLEGDLVVFPSHLRHSVALQGFETERCTAAGNLLVVGRSELERPQRPSWRLRG